MLQKTKESLEEVAKQYINEEKGVANVQEALEGARDIIAENISDEADYRSWIRKQTMQKGHIISSAKDEKAESVYENYYEFDEPVTEQLKAENALEWTGCLNNIRACASRDRKLI